MASKRRGNRTVIRCTADWLVAVLCLLVWLVGSPGTTWAQGDANRISPGRRSEIYDQLHREVSHLQRHYRIVKTVIRLTLPTVVHIEAQKTEQLRGQLRRSEETGSGVIVKLSDRHFVITNRHVIENASRSRIRIRLSDGRVIRPLQVWSDPDTDIAVMSIAASRLTAARLGDSNGVEIGDFVLAVGSPFGLSHSITQGIISAKGRRDLELGTSDVKFQDFLQTDASINPGNSGGPLVNLRGEVIGINTAIASRSGINEGIGFSIPINMVNQVAVQLVEKGRVERAFLGVNLDVRFDAEAAFELGLSSARGARVVGVTPASPAAEASLKNGDVILKFNDVKIEDDAHLVNVVALTGIGKKVSLEVWRNGALMQMSVQVGDRSAFDTERPR